MASKHVAEEGLDQRDKKRIKQAVITLGPYPGLDCGEEPLLRTPPDSPSRMAAEQIQKLYQPKTRSLRQATVVTVAGEEQAVKETSRLLGGFLDRIGELDLVIEKSHKTTLREITAAVSSTQFPTSAG
jgi:hypothetical protein